MRDLVQEYLAADPELLGFYARPPKDLFATPPQAAPWHPELVTAIQGYNTRLGNVPQFNGDEALIVTGQQAGLFTGPLYAIYKAISTIRLARRLQAQFGVPCVPLFWVAGDDHDFEEVRTAYFLTKTHEPLSLTYAPEQPVDGRPMYRVPIEESLHALIEEAAARTPGSEFRDDVTRALHDTLDASASLADWAARLMARLFRDTPLILFAPHMPVARKLAQQVLAREVAEPLATTELLNQAGARLQKLGFTQQLVKGESECSFFLDMGGRRRKVLFEAGRYVLPEERLSCSIDEMQAFLTAAPERFSPNAALRCIVQQHLFPVAAYVAGPGEVAYWAQLKPVFERFSYRMPVVYPRARAVLTTLKLSRLLQKFGFTLDDLAGGHDALTERALRQVTRGPARDSVQQGRQAVETAFEELVQNLAKQDQTAARMARHLHENVATGLDRIERSVLAADKAQVDAVKRQVARLCNALAPFRKPQERVYTVFSFLFEQGWDLIPRLIAGLDITSFQLNEVEL